MAAHDDQGLRLLFEHAKQSGTSGQIDLALTLGTLDFSPREVHQVAYALLNSKEKMIVTEALYIFGSHYAAICNAQERRVVEQLTKSNEPEIRLAAKRTLVSIEQHGR